MRIDVVHALPHSASAFGQDDDGFTRAMAIIGRTHEVRWINVHPANPDHREQRARVGDGDFVLVRSDWWWYPDLAVPFREVLRGTPAGLIIAGSSRPPSELQARRYDVLFYETPWYADHVGTHPYAVRAFGVDRAVMRDLGVTRDIDWLFVGRLNSFKRPLALLEKPGRKVAVGDFASADPLIREQLESAGVELVDHVPQEQLAQLYNRATNVLVPCAIDGGGERAVLEARACGCAVEVAEDNPKLASLLRGSIPDAADYAAIVQGALEQVVAGRRVPRSLKVAGRIDNERLVLQDKVRRLPSTVRIRWANRRHR